MCFLLMMCHMTLSRPNSEDASQSHIINTVVALVSCRAWKCVVIVMIKQERTFFPFSEHLHYAMIKREKIFFIIHYVHYTMIKREISFFSFSHYVHYTIIKIGKSFFSFSHQVHYAMINRKMFFHFSTTFVTPQLQEKEIDFYCTTILTTLRS